ncbi:aldo/keto reductase [Myceligenerans xiligouense]|uniref:Aryl-alcohol dehydrogenase-like predicted oxidoreductase n=1 Tax=Myceligenerans xiligouense TaxID=253184 RepID=A0A3N4Z5R8_9MICO|nr:aldo/keto reductase [Myceligenerans xiligouense]RPF21198.1 aryl-alcohol dehydrogenase-like predicted oxidoreductase [Myceligenerans xiligouense]
MKYRFLGRTGLEVSPLALGTMTFGREADEPTSRRVLDTFADAGGNFVDTADVYNGGASEEILGRWLKGRRDDVVVATKVRYNASEGPNTQGLSRRRIIAAVEESLRRLETDYIDLYQIHAWDPMVPLEETLSTLDGLVRSGKVRYIGASNVTASQLQKAVDLSRGNGWEPFRSLQPLYNLLDRDAELELFDVCRAEGLGVVAWSPLRGGWLTGRMRRADGAPAPGTRVETAEKLGWGESWSAYAAEERTWRILDTLDEIAGERSRPVPQVALAWLLAQPDLTAPIVGARDAGQLAELLPVTEWALSEDELARLDEASAIRVPYPYSEIAKGAAGR